MAEFVVVKECPVLLPNTTHKNFTQSRIRLREGQKLNGGYKRIEGLRRGEPFTYNLFITDNNEVLHANNVKPMETTEVKLGADASTTPTVVSVAPAEKASTQKVAIITAIAAVGGFAFCKWKKYPMKKTLVITGIVAIAGLLVAKQFPSTTGIKVQKSK